jgi:hypothetical protein
MSTTTHQIAANRCNAQLSTGPITEEGKDRSSQNATRHGFTGLTLIVTPEERELYQAHVQATFAEHRPAGHRQTLLVQQLADIDWSLQQISVEQANTISLLNALQVQIGHTCGDPIYAAGILAPVIRGLNTLSIYESRRRRAAKGIAEELAALQSAAPIPNKTEPPPEIGFVRSSDEIPSRLLPPQSSPVTKNTQNEQLPTHTASEITYLEQKGPR